MDIGLVRGGGRALGRAGREVSYGTERTKRKS